MGVLSDWLLPQAMSSVLGMVLREGIPGLIREESIHGEPVSFPLSYRATP